LEKAIEIKRRAQRCLQSGDLDGALSEYEKLTRAEDSEPINFVLMADLLFKKGATADAGQCYLRAVDAYGKAGLYKNAIAVCKKMTRLSLTPTLVLQRLAELHALDGLKTEAALYYQEYADHQAREEKFKDAAESARRAFEATPENVRLLERASEWLETAGDPRAAAVALAEAGRHYADRGQTDDAERARRRARELDPESGGELEPEPSEPALAAAASPAAPEIFESAEPAPATEEADLAPSVEVVDPPVVEAADPEPTALRFEGLGEPEPSEEQEPAGLAEIESLLKQAAERFERGDREQASDSLVRAARAYEAVQRLESAAAIYRSLGRSAHASPEIMGLWLRNCELRGDSVEAAEVACALGDRALNEDDAESAREWFARALRHVPDHETAKRRLQRLGSRAPKAPPGPNGAKTGGAEGRVEVAVGRAQAVTLDLGSLISEFQHGIESQLSDDAQSHYDLGMTYREMGLFDQAVECFRAASRSPDFAERAAEMIGRCLLDQGRFEEAVQEFARALEDLGDRPMVGTGLRYQLGLAHEVAGHVPEALAQFERVYAEQPNYPDVAQKIRILRRTLENV
jgi:tetratricopeptide (TPR) repeat protein